MKRETLLNTVGIALLVACFALSLVRVAGRSSAARDPGVERIRFSHWQLEGGLRQAFDELSREYEAAHPGVVVEQVAIPERTYAQWLRTQLVGETVTDLVQLGIGADDELIARFFTPLTEHVERPNPHNRGTPLETTPLRDTILDGMQGGYSYRQALLEYYGVPVSMFTVRMFYNRTLWRSIFGDEPPPEDYDAFLAVCERVRAHGEKTGRSLIPVAGSKANAPMLVQRLAASQTQRLNQSQDTLRMLRPGVHDVFLGLLAEKWSLDDPAFTSALEITRETSAYFQPGYTQLAREDASFYFLQGRALMIATGSWDSPSFRAQADFEIGVFSLPVPSADHPRYGRHTLGRASEAETGTGLTFGIPRMTKNFDRALDFLLFLASHPGNTRFTQTSGWLPSVVGVEPPDHVKPFLPYSEGYVDGFDLILEGLGSHSKRLLAAESNRLVGAGGSVENFRSAIRAPLLATVRDDLERLIYNNTLNLTRQDVAAAAQHALARAPDAPAGENSPAAKLSQLLEAQNKIEAQNAWYRHELDRTAAAARSR